MMQDGRRGEVERLEIARISAQLRELMWEMELHAEQDSKADFDRWWLEEGRRARYFAMKGQKERLEARLQRLEGL